MRHFAGLDLGQASDFTALTILRKSEPPSPPPGYVRAGPADPVRYDCGYLERIPLGTAYPDIAHQMRELLARPPFRGTTTLVVDATGVGRPVVDMLRREGLSPVPVTITGGDTVSRDGPGYRVPKRDLVGAVQVLLQTGRLRFAAGLPTVPKLVKELQDFRVRINATTAHDSYGAWRVGAMTTWSLPWRSPPGSPSALHRSRSRSHFDRGPDPLHRATPAEAELALQCPAGGRRARERGRAPRHPAASGLHRRALQPVQDPVYRLPCQAEATRHLRAPPPVPPGTIPPPPGGALLPSGRAGLASVVTTVAESR